MNCRSKNFCQILEHIFGIIYNQNHVTEYYNEFEKMHNLYKLSEIVLKIRYVMCNHDQRTYVDS